MCSPSPSCAGPAWTRGRGPPARGSALPPHPVCLQSWLCRTLPKFISLSTAEHAGRRGLLRPMQTLTHVCLETCHLLSSARVRVTVTPSTPTAEVSWARGGTLMQSELGAAGPAGAEAGGAGLASQRQAPASAPFRPLSHQRPRRQTMQRRVGPRAERLLGRLMSL